MLTFNPWDINRCDPRALKTEALYQTGGKCPSRMGPTKSNPPNISIGELSFLSIQRKQNLGLPINVTVPGDADLVISDWCEKPLWNWNRKGRGVNRALALRRVIIPAVWGGNLSASLPLHSDICIEANASLVIAPECQSAWCVCSNQGKNEDFSIKGREAKKKCRQIIGEEIMELAIKSNGVDWCFLHMPAKGVCSD